MKILVTHTKDLFKVYFNTWLERQEANNNLHVTTDEEEQEENVIVYTGKLPTVSDIVAYINSFISSQKKSKKNILKYYFIIDAFAKLTKLLKRGVFNIAIDLKKLYSRFVKAIQKRISDQNFYLDDVETLNDKALANVFANIGQNNVIMFNLQQVG
jgi:hypothetical protein